MKRIVINKEFTFKQFSLSDSDCAMKIGTDAVLLGSYAARFKAEKVLDIGTGCGIIALMVAQKTGTHIDAVEPDYAAAQQSRENFTASPWTHKLQVFCTHIQQFSQQPLTGYDLIVCNPPYFENSLHNPSPEKALARHNHALTRSELFRHVSGLLAADGIFSMIYPAGKETILDEDAAAQALLLKERIFISPSPGRPAKRTISTYTGNHREVAPQIRHMNIETGLRHHFSEEYINLTGDYHPFL